MAVTYETIASSPSKKCLECTIDALWTRGGFPSSSFKIQEREGEHFRKWSLLIENEEEVEAAREMAQIFISGWDWCVRETVASEAKKILNR